MKKRVLLVIAAFSIGAILEFENCGMGQSASQFNIDTGTSGSVTVEEITFNQSSFLPNQTFIATATLENGNPNLQCQWYTEYNGGVLTNYGTSTVTGSGSNCVLTGTVPSAPGQYALYLNVADTTGNSGSGQTLIVVSLSSPIPTPTPGGSGGTGYSGCLPTAATCAYQIYGSSCSSGVTEPSSQPSQCSSCCSGLASILTYEPETPGCGGINYFIWACQ